MTGATPGRGRMSRSTTTSPSGWSRCAGLLTVVPVIPATVILIALRLLRIIAWPWWLVLSPVWMSAGCAVAVLLVFAVAAMVMAVMER